MRIRPESFLSIGDKISDIQAGKRLSVFSGGIVLNHDMPYSVNFGGNMDGGFHDGDREAVAE
jgi:histidinol phosphatase-like enzyme